MNSSTEEIKVIKRSVELIRERKNTRTLFGMQTKIPSAIVTAWQIFDPKNNHITATDHIQIVQAIALPNAKLFFLSHKAEEKNCIENLAIFIENNSFDSSLI